MTNVLVKDQPIAAAAVVTRPRPVPAPPPPGRRQPWWRSNGAAALLFLSPTLVVFGTFILFPILFSFYLSFHQWNMFSAERSFVGADNYARMFSEPEFWSVFGHTAVYTLGTVPLNMALSLAAAYFLNKQIAGKKLVRAALFSPVIISSVAAAVIWRWILDPNLGVLNTALGFFGIPAVSWINEPGAAMAALIGVGVWKTFGVNMVLFSAGLSGVPESYYEAAELDGASPWRKFWHVTLPLLSPTLLFVVVLSVISSFQVFDIVYVLTYGGPLGSTKVLVYYLFEHAFKFFDMGYASAVAYLLFGVLSVLTVVQIRLFRKWGHEAV